MAKKAKYADTEKSRRRPRRQLSTAGQAPARRKSSSPAQERTRPRQQPQTAGRQKRTAAPPPAPRPTRRRRDPLERMIQTPPPVNQRKSEQDAVPQGMLNVQQLQQQIDEQASLAIGRFEGPGTCPHCRQTVHRPWHLQFGDPPIDLYFCNAALIELKYLVDQIKDPRKG